MLGRSRFRHGPILAVPDHFRSTLMVFGQNFGVRNDFTGLFTPNKLQSRCGVILFSAVSKHLQASFFRS